MGARILSKTGAEEEYPYLPRIRDLREDEDMTQEDVARILDTSQTMYSRYERGINEMPVRHLIRLCHLYRVTSDYILGLSDNKKPSSQL